MGIELGTEILRQAITNTLVFNTDWIINIILTILTLVAITRNVQKWKELALPIMIGWHVSGVTPSILAYIVCGIFFVLEYISINQITELAQTSKAIIYDKNPITEQHREKRREEGIIQKAIKTQRKSQLETYLNKQPHKGELPFAAGELAERMKLSKKDIEMIAKQGGLRKEDKEGFLVDRLKERERQRRITEKIEGRGLFIPINPTKRPITEREQAIIENRPRISKSKTEKKKLKIRYEKDQTF